MGAHYAISVALCHPGARPGVFPIEIFCCRSPKTLKTAVQDAFAEGRQRWGEDANIVVSNRVFRHSPDKSRVVYIKKIVDPDGSLYGDKIR